MRLSADILGNAEQRPNALGEREIVLRGLAIPAIEHLGATRDAFDTIDLTENRITRIENFPKLQRLSTLMLAGNAIEGKARHQEQNWTIQHPFHNQDPEKSRKNVQTDILIGLCEIKVLQLDLLNLGRPKRDREEILKNVPPPLRLQRIKAALDIQKKKAKVLK